MNSLNNLFEFSVSPVGITTFLLCGGFILSILRRRQQLGRWLLVAGTFLFLLFTFSPLAELVIASLERDYPPLTVPPTSVQVSRIAVLSGYGEDHPGFPATSSLFGEMHCRLAEGIRLYRLVPESKMILSGGAMCEGDRPISSIMADFVREMGVPDKDVIVEGGSRNTYENMVEVKKVVGLEPFILVTSACALRRAMAVARKLGMRPVAAPACIWALQNCPSESSWTEWIGRVLRGFGSYSPDRWVYLQSGYHEYLGYVWYKLIGRI